MRKIKYRQPIENSDGEFVQWHYWGLIDGVFVNPAGYGYSNKETTSQSQQYTGIKDKNDTDIYEGDIVGFWPNYTNKPTGYKKGVVKYTDYKLVLDVNGLEYDAFEETDESPYTWEILGNVHENPDLIEKPESLTE